MRLTGYFRRVLCSVILGVAWSASGAVSAQDVALKNGYPERYIVQKGDTLWDIAGRFLKDPWMWKSIWQGNPAIKNPDLIYPGDIIAMVWVDGKPQLRVSRDGPLPVVKLSPKTISSPVSDAITTVPLTVLKNFFNLTRVTSIREIEEAPYVLKPENERVVMSMIGDRGFVRGLTDDSRRRFSVYRQGNPYVDPITGDVLGFEAFHVGDAVLERFGDPSMIRMESVKREVNFGDRLLDPDPQGNFYSFQPEPVADGTEARIVSVVDGVSQVSRFNIVVINKGQKEGMKPGSVLGVYQDRGRVIDRLHRQYVEEHVALEDPDLVYADEETINELREKKRETLALPGRMSGEVDLPSEQAGIVMVFRAHQRVSYALVMESLKPLAVGDRLGKPLPGS